jgi:acyl-CoA hydrolase
LIAGLLTPDVLALEGRGVLDERWAIPVGEAFGPQSLMRQIDRSSRLSFRSTRRLHDARSLGELPGLVTVNTALAVDLLGRVACERFADNVTGGLGGLTEFLMGGRLSPGGVNIVVLTAASRGRARIVRELASEDVGVPAFLVDYVVTDWGVADMRGATIAERRERIAAIADPAHQGDLEELDLDKTQEEV